jgi:hypothetical protein
MTRISLKTYTGTNQVRVPSLDNMLLRREPSGSYSISLDEWGSTWEPYTVDLLELALTGKTQVLRVMLLLDLRHELEQKQRTGR